MTLLLVTISAVTDGQEVTSESPFGVTKVFWFCVKDWGDPGHGLCDVDGKPKLAFYAYLRAVHVCRPVGSGG